MRCQNHRETDAVALCSYCKGPFCADCLVEIDGRYVCREDVVHLLKKADHSSAPTPSSTVVNNYYNYGNTNPQGDIYGGFSTPRKSKWATFFLAFFLGAWGIHRFYLGKIGSAVLYLFTMGVFGIGWLVDLILIISGNMTDSNGQPLV